MDSHILLMSGLWRELCPVRVLLLWFRFWAVDPLGRPDMSSHVPTFPRHSLYTALYTQYNKRDNHGVLHSVPSVISFVSSFVCPHWTSNQLEKLEAARGAWLVCISLLSLTGSFWVLPGPSGSFWLNFFWPYRALLSITRPYLALLGLPGPSWALLSLTRPYFTFAH